MPEIKLTRNLLDPELCRNLVADDNAGGQVVFIGAVRNHSRGKEVTHLDYEAYGPMAEREMARIAQHATARFDLLKTAIHHRIGTLKVGEVAVVVAVSAPHRAAAFEACSFIIDELKKDVPIWKREYFTDGAEWVSDRP